MTRSMSDPRSLSRMNRIYARISLSKTYKERDISSFYLFNFCNKNLWRLVIISFSQFQLLEEFLESGIFSL